MAVEYRDLLDDYEAGEIAVELDDKDPQEVIAWSIERFHEVIDRCSRCRDRWLCRLARRPSRRARLVRPL